MNLVAFHLGDGRWLALEPEAFREALEAARALGLGVLTMTSSVSTSVGSERWLTSQQLAEKTDIHSTTWEAKAKSGEVPSIRVGKSLRFKLSDIETALKGGQ